MSQIKPQHAPQSAAHTDGYVLDDQVGFLMRMASQRHATIFQSHAPDGLTPTQFSALVRLAEMGACSQNRLGRLISVDVATIKGVVDRLKRKGLVALAADPTDKRRTIISLTSSALALVQALHQSGARITEETLQPLSPAEQATLIELLRKIS